MVGRDLLTEDYHRVADEIATAWWAQFMRGEPRWIPSKHFDHGAHFAQAHTEIFEKNNESYERHREAFSGLRRKPRSSDERAAWQVIDISRHPPSRQLLVESGKDETQFRARLDRFEESRPLLRQFRAGSLPLVEDRWVREATELDSAGPTASANTDPDQDDALEDVEVDSREDSAERSEKRGGPVPAPPRADREAATNTRQFRAVSSSDWSDEEHRNRALGLAGERFVVAWERDWLRENERDDLAMMVRHVSSEIGDGLGYDVLSFDLEGGKKFIEVKTTLGSATSDFFLSENERAFAAQAGQSYYLYRVHDFDEDRCIGSFYIVRGPVEHEFSLTPTMYRARR